MAPVRLPRRTLACGDNPSGLPSDNTHERGFYRLVCVEAETGTFIAKYAIG
jgi:hypothetical protein